MTALLNPPLEPGADEARDLLLRELTKPIYDDGMSLFERFIFWLLGLVDDGHGVSDGVSLSLTLAVVTAGIIIIAIIFWRTGPLRRNRRIAQGVEVFDGHDEDADQLRNQAQQAAAAQNFDRAVIEQFRALVRSLQDRVLITDHTGLTAQEAVSQAAIRFPGQITDLELAARSFSEVLYGKRPATAAQYEQLRTLDGLLDRTKPTRLNQATVEVAQ